MSLSSLASLSPAESRTSLPDWRVEADRRIEEYRKGDHHLRLLDAEGRPLTGVTVSLEQTGHNFKFGTCVSHTWLARDDADARKYREFISRHFNTVVGESSMKWAYTEPERGVHDFTHADALMSFAETNGLAVRGHTLFWTKPKYHADWVGNLEGGELETAMMHHMERILPRYRGRLIAWDGINEMITSKHFEERIDGDIHARIYRRAHELDPDTPLFTNEYSILCNDKGLNGYVEILDSLLEDGVTLGGIGIQEHAAERIVDVPPEGERMERLSQFRLTPRGMWTRLDRLAEYGLPVHLTEISFRADDEAKRAEAVDKFFRTAFAHPAVEVIMLWGFWQRAHWLGRPAALFDADLEPYPAGDALLHLLEDEWKTRLQAETDTEGNLNFRGFYGPYRLTILHGNGQKTVKTFEHTRRETDSTLRFPEISGK